MAVSASGEAGGFSAHRPEFESLHRYQGSVEATVFGLGSGYLWHRDTALPHLPDLPVNKDGLDFQSVTVTCGPCCNRGRRSGRFSPRGLMDQGRRCSKPTGAGSNPAGETKRCGVVDETATLWYNDQLCLTRHRTLLIECYAGLVQR